MPATQLPGIPEPTPDPAGAVRTMQAMKEIIEIQSGIRGDLLDKTATFRDLVDLGLITVEAALAQAK